MRYTPTWTLPRRTGCRSTLERQIVEIKRRTNVVDVFLDDMVITRLVGVLLEQSDGCALRQRCM